MNVKYFCIETEDGVHYFASESWGRMIAFAQSPVVKWGKEAVRETVESIVEEKAEFFKQFINSGYQLATDGIYSLGVQCKNNIRVDTEFDRMLKRAKRSRVESKYYKSQE